MSQHDCNVVDWDVKPQTNEQTNTEDYDAMITLMCYLCYSVANAASSKELNGIA